MASRPRAPPPFGAGVSSMPVKVPAIQIGLFCRPGRPAPGSPGRWVWAPGWLRAVRHGGELSRGGPRGAVSGGRLDRLGLLPGQRV